jgi:hypothetical protein
MRASRKSLCPAKSPYEKGIPYRTRVKEQLEAVERSIELLEEEAPPGTSAKVSILRALREKRFALIGNS